MSAAPTSLAWFARHELSLVWRDWLAMMTAGKPTRARVLLLAIIGFVALLHLMANAIVAPWAAAGVVPDKQTLVLLSGSGLLFFSLMLSQALESVTRAYYTRSDLDLILSSPASSRRLFAIRTGAVALSTIALSCLLAGPVINVLVVHDGPRWLAAYGVLAAMGALAAALAVIVTIGLFKLVGPRRTRFISQIIAAIVGAGFIIGIQASAIISYGSLSQVSVLTSPQILALAPDVGSSLWLPARAAMGDWTSLAILLILGFGLLTAVVITTSSRFGQHAVAAAGVSQTRYVQSGNQAHYRQRTQRQTLRHKEWALLRRDPWLLSQTLMQILYLLPPALLLWLNYGKNAGAFVVVVPVLVMASGQLAGGLAWLAISGEDAHDLVVTAPVAPRAILRAKIEAVLGVIAMVIAPLALLIAIASPALAMVAIVGVTLSAASATLIQLWFRMPMKRSMFRRRQIASRTATFSEAFASIMWAGAAGIAAAGSVLAVVPAVLAMAVMGLAWAVSPRGKGR